MLKRPSTTDVLVQGYYMSGDRNTIATALRLTPKLGVLVISSVGGEARAEELKQLYTRVAGETRVEVYEAPQGTYPSGLEAAKAAYQEVADHCRNRGSVQRPAWVSAHVDNAVQLQPATHGTKEISSKFDQGRTGETQKKIRELWRLPQDQDEENGIRNQVGTWLRDKGFRHDRAYVFLFAKQGARTAEKAHHFTSILTWRLLVERISTETTVIPVAMGDNIGLRTTPTLVEFWNDGTWKAIFSPPTMSATVLDDRSAQLGMWCYLAEEYPGLSIIGMRSGMLEVPALLGIRTLYLEEKHNDQATRMEKWLESEGTKLPEGVPGFSRLIVNRPPGIAQQIYWRAQALKGSEKSKSYQHAASTGGHVANMVLGFKKEGLSKAQVVQCVFGPDQLAEVLGSVEKFRLETSEFNQIIEWVKRTTKPKGATSNVHGSIPGSGQLQKRDLALQNSSALQHVKNWSEYFKSQTYLDSIGIAKR